MPLPPTTKLALETVEALFADHGSDLARARCRAEMFCAKRENERVSDLVYGEFGFMALASVLAKHRDAMPETGGVFLDLGSGIAVTSVGNAAPAVVRNVHAQVDAFTHTCFMVTPYEGYVDVCEALARLTPGEHDKKPTRVGPTS